MDNAQHLDMGLRNRMDICDHKTTFSDRPENKGDVHMTDCTFWSRVDHCAHNLDRIFPGKEKNRRLICCDHSDGFEVVNTSFIYIVGKRSIFTRSL